MIFSKGNSRRSRGDNRGSSSDTSSSYGREHDFEDNSYGQFSQQNQQYGTRTGGQEYGQDSGQQSGRGQQGNYSDRTDDRQSTWGGRGDRYGDYDQSGYSGGKNTSEFDYDFDEDRNSSFRNRQEDEDSGLNEERRTYSQGQLGDEWGYEGSDRWQRGNQQGTQQNRSGGRSQTSVRNDQAQGSSRAGDYGSQSARASQRSKSRW